MAEERKFLQIKALYFVTLVVFSRTSQSSNSCRLPGCEDKAPDSVSSRISYLRPVQFLTTIFSFYIATFSCASHASSPGLFTSVDYRPRTGRHAGEGGI